MGSITFRELLDRDPNFAKRRQINANALRRLLGRPNGHCTWCGDIVPPKRRTWCSRRCVDEFRLHCDPQVAAKFVYDRDGGVCQMCGRDTKLCERVFWRFLDDLQPASGRKIRTTSYFQQAIRDPEVAEIARILGWGRGEWREVDHIVPVAQGGGLCGPDNLRLLCGVCHHSVTNPPSLPAGVGISESL